MYDLEQGTLKHSERGVAMLELGLILVVVMAMVVGPLVAFAPSFTGDNVDVLALDAMNSLQPREYTLTYLTEEGFILEMDNGTVTSTLGDIINDLAVRSETQPDDWCTRLLFLPGTTGSPDIGDIQEIQSSGALCPAQAPLEMKQSFFASVRSAELGMEPLNAVDQFAIGVESTNPLFDRWVIYQVGTNPGP